jgi:ABC-2 type transport system permease protein
LAVAVGLAIEFIFSAMVAMTMSNVYILYQIRDAVTVLLSGAILPLALYPWGLGAIFGWLPFASMASAPLRIYTETGDPFLLLVIQAGWIIILWPLSYGLWRVNRERLTSHGG